MCEFGSELSCSDRLFSLPAIKSAVVGYVGVPGFKICILDALQYKSVSECKYKTDLLFLFLFFSSLIHHHKHFICVENLMIGMTLLCKMLMFLNLYLKTSSC